MFTLYMELLLAEQWFERGKVLIMDNGTIHTGQEAAIVASL